MRIPGVPYHQGIGSYTDTDGRHYGIAIHDTENTASDTAEAAYADHRTDGTSAHFFVDRDSVTQSLDTDAKAGHSGSQEGNENAIAFEITGTAGRSRDWWLTNVAWDQLGRVIGYMIRNDPDYAGFQVRRASVAEMKANPKVRAFYGHNDMRLAWGGTNHTDPGENFPWDRLFQAVNASIEEPDMTPAQATNFDQMVARVDALLSNKDVSWTGAPIRNEPNLLKVKLNVIEAKVDAALIAIAKIGSGSPEVTAVLAALDELKATLETEVRDAVADLGEGGAEKVRADQP